MSVKYLISFKNGDKKLVDRHFKLNDWVFCLTINKLTHVQQLEGQTETVAFSCPESSIEYIEELPVSHQMMITFNQIFEELNDDNDEDISAEELIMMKREADEIDKIYI
jgi:hypothetical protein